MTDLYNYPTENALQYQLDALLSAGNTTSMTLNATLTSKIRSPGVCWVDRVDANGNRTASKREYIIFTGVSGTQLTGLTRGQAGSTDQEHAVGAIVEFGPDVLQAKNVYDVLTTDHNSQGLHISLISLGVVRTKELINTSQASIRQGYFGNLINASGASLQGFPIRPTWVIRGAQSLASVGVGPSLAMPEDGTWSHFSATLPRGFAVSSASLILDVNKNGVSIFEAGTRPSILGGGTFVSTASINTKAFSRGDMFDIDTDQLGNKVDITVQGHAR